MSVIVDLVKRVTVVLLCLGQIIHPSWAMALGEEVAVLRKTTTHKAKLSLNTSSPQQRDIDCHDIKPLHQGSYHLAFDPSLHEENFSLYLMDAKKLVGVVSFKDKKLIFQGLTDKPICLASQTASPATKAYIYPAFQACVAGNLFLKGGQFSQATWLQAKNITLEDTAQSSNSLALWGEEGVTIKGKANAASLVFKAKSFLNQGSLRAKDIHLDVETGENAPTSEIVAEQDIVLKGFKDFHHKGCLLAKRNFATDGSNYLEFPDSQTYVGVMKVANGVKYHSCGRVAAFLNLTQTKETILGNGQRFDGDYFLTDSCTDVKTSPASHIQCRYAVHLHSVLDITHKGGIYLPGILKCEFPYNQFASLLSSQTPRPAPSSIDSTTIIKTTSDLQTLQRQVLPLVLDLEGVSLHANEVLIHEGVVKAAQEGVTYKSDKFYFSGYSQSGFSEGVKTVVKATTAVLDGVMKASSQIYLDVSKSLKISGLLDARAITIVFPEKVVLPVLPLAAAGQITAPANPAVTPATPAPAKKAEPQQTSAKSAPVVAQKPEPQKPAAAPAKKPEPLKVAPVPVTPPPAQVKKDEPVKPVAPASVPVQKLAAPTPAVPVVSTPAAAPAKKPEPLKTAPVPVTSSPAQVKKDEPVKPVAPASIPASVPAQKSAAPTPAVPIVSTPAAAPAKKPEVVQPVPAPAVAQKPAASNPVPTVVTPAPVIASAPVVPALPATPVKQDPPTRCEITATAKIKGALSIANVDQAAIAGHIQGKQFQLDAQKFLLETSALIETDTAATIKANSAQLAGQLRSPDIRMDTAQTTITETGQVKGRSVDLNATEATTTAGQVEAHNLAVRTQQFSVTESGSIRATGLSSVTAPSAQIDGQLQTVDLALKTPRLGIGKNGRVIATGKSEIEARERFVNQGILRGGDDIVLKLGRNYSIGNTRSDKWLDLTAENLPPLEDILAGKHPELIQSWGLYLRTSNPVTFTHSVHVPYALGLEAPQMTTPEPQAKGQPKVAAKAGKRTLALSQASKRAKRPLRQGRKKKTQPPAPAPIHLSSDRTLDLTTTQGDLRLDHVSGKNVYLTSADHLVTRDVRFQDEAILEAVGNYTNAGQLLGPRGQAQIRAHSIFNPLPGNVMQADRLLLEATHGNIENGGTIQGLTYLQVKAAQDILEKGVLHQGKIPTFTPAAFIGGNGIAYTTEGGETRRLGLRLEAGGKIENYVSHLKATGDIALSAQRGITHKADAVPYMAKKWTKKKGFLKHKKETHIIWSNAVGRSVIHSSQGRIISHTPQGGIQYIGCESVGREGDQAVIRDQIQYFKLLTQDRHIVKKSSFFGLSQSKATAQHQVPILTRFINGSPIEHRSQLSDIIGEGVQIMAPTYRGIAKGKVTFDGINLKHSLHIKTRSLLPSFAGSQTLTALLEGRSARSSLAHEDPLVGQIYDLAHAKGKAQKTAQGIKTRVQAWKDVKMFSEAFQQGQIPAALLERFGQVGLAFSRSSFHHNTTTTTPSQFNVQVLDLQGEGGVELLGGTQAQIEQLFRVRGPYLKLGKATHESHQTFRSSSFGGGYNLVSGLPYIESSHSSSWQKDKTYHNALVHIYGENGRMDVGELDRLELDGGTIITPHATGHIRDLIITTYQDEHQGGSKSVSASFSGTKADGMTGAVHGGSYQFSSRKAQHHSRLDITQGLGDDFTVDHLTVTDTDPDPALAAVAQHASFVKLYDASKSKHISLGLSYLDLNSPEAFGQSVGRSLVTVGAGIGLAELTRAAGGDDVASSVAGTIGSLAASGIVNGHTPQREPHPQTQTGQTQTVGGYHPTPSGLNIAGEVSYSRKGKSTHIIALDLNPGQLERNWDVMRETLATVTAQQEHDQDPLETLGIVTYEDAENTEDLSAGEEASQLTKSTPHKTTQKNKEKQKRTLSKKPSLAEGLELIQRAQDSRNQHAFAAILSEDEARATSSRSRGRERTSERPLFRPPSPTRLRTNYTDTVEAIKSEVRSWSQAREEFEQSGSSFAHLSKKDALRVVGAYGLDLVGGAYEGADHATFGLLSTSLEAVDWGIDKIKTGVRRVTRYATGDQRLGQNAGDYVGLILSTVGPKGLNAGAKALRTGGKLATASKAGSTLKALDLPSNAANGLRLRTMLSFQEKGILNAQGRLTKQAIEGAERVILQEGTLKNPHIVKILTKDGSNIKDWHKFSTESARMPNGQSMRIHFYKNIKTGKVDQLTRDFKIKGIVKQ